MTPMLRMLPLMLLCLTLAACGGDKTPSEGDGKVAQEDDHGHAHEGAHGGVMVVSSDHAMHFEIAHDEGAGLVKLWLYDGDVKPVSTSEVPVINIPLDPDPVQVEGVALGDAKSATEWHFSHAALKGHVHDARIRVLANNRSYMVDFPHEEHGEHDDHEGHEHDGDEHGHDDHDGHEHAHEGTGPHHGLVHPFSSKDGKTTGFIELKLHDDKGDLELWIAQDKAMKTPFDLPLDAQVTVQFSDKQVALRVRNTQENEDEDGVANNRDGNTNYFIFPGDSGADAGWLQGKAFKATVTVAFTTPAGAVTTQAFELTPHTH